MEHSCKQLTTSATVPPRWVGASPSPVVFGPSSAGTGLAPAEGAGGRKTGSSPVLPRPHTPTLGRVGTKHKRWQASAFRLQYPRTCQGARILPRSWASACGGLHTPILLLIWVSPFNQQAKASSRFGISAKTRSCAKWTRGPRENGM